MIPFYFVSGLICLAIAILSGFGGRLKLNRWLRLILGVIGLVLFGLGMILFAVPEEPAPSVAHITFDALPDGTPITSERILDGDEFITQGILLAGAPESTYCAEATATAIRGAGRYSGITFHFLTPAMADDIDMCNGIPIEITFTEPVRQVTLTFTGASVVYSLKAYDNEGELLGVNETEAVFGAGETFDATFRSPRANISRITFGRTTAITAITEIYYER